jgi:tetratricopeptide (TPR) repeat protein
VSTMPGKIQQQPQPDVNSVLDQLERVVRWSEEFQLVFVKCNHPAQQEILQHALLARLHDKRVLEVVLEQPIVSLLDEITARWDSAAPPQAVCVYHLERSINEQREASPVLGRLNHDRDLLRRAVPATLLLWLPDFALDCVARGAPDFWAWRSGVYEFPADRELWHFESAVALTPETSALFSLPLEDKQKEIARLSELLRTARAWPRHGKRERQTAAYLSEQLALLHYSLGERDKAQEFLEEALTLFQQLHDQKGIASAYHNLGIFAQDRGAYEEALEWYRRSLVLEEELGNRAGMASSYHQLGVLAQNRGAYEEALEWYRRSLVLEEELGNRAGMVNSYHQLGDVAYLRGAYEEALEWYHRSLALAEELGNRAGMVNSYHQLGDVAYLRGAYEEALKWYRRSLVLAEELGNRADMAASYSRIGVLFTTRGTPDAAVSWTLRGLLIRMELCSPEIRTDLHWLTQQRQQLGETRLLSLLRERLSEKDAQAILRLLDDFVSDTQGDPVEPVAEAQRARATELGDHTNATSSEPLSAPPSGLPPEA